MIYYVEDDTNIRELTLYALKQAGFEAHGFAAAEEFFKALAEQQPKLSCCPASTGWKFSNAFAPRLRRVTSR